MGRTALVLVALVFCGCPGPGTSTPTPANVAPRSVAPVVTAAREPSTPGLEFVELAPVDSRRSPLEAYLAPHSSESEPLTVTEK